MDNFERNEKEMLNKKIWAVIGATPKTDKFGYKVWKKLEEHGYVAYPINPNYEEIEGKSCYKSLKDLPQKPEVVNFVVPPVASLEILPVAKELGVEYLWFQPGAADESVIVKAEELGLNITYNACVLVELG